MREDDIQIMTSLINKIYKSVYSTMNNYRIFAHITRGLYKILQTQYPPAGYKRVRDIPHFIYRKRREKGKKLCKEIHVIYNP